MEERNKRRQERLLGRSGVESLCAALCHDLRGPVATAGAALLSLSHRLSPDAAEAEGRLLEIARQSLATADEMLASVPCLIAASDEPTLQPVDLRALLDALRDDVRFELRLVEGTLRVQGALSPVLADRERLRIALRNLLRNAIRYRRRSSPLTITVRTWRRGDDRTITVSDNGIGIPRSEHRRIFAPLARVPGTGVTGSGLGLTIARQAIESMGGTIAVSSRPGVGTSFAVTLRSARATGA
jgi:signal transduction histidine kinase